ncbi:IclR family transcriptional regulator [Pseudonocardia endophytica]|uniref:Glycerol operon regulatory protein n=1 Tax=Pseudonocardia endophytica TaxID=401976 RepID=A0A4R1HYS8_PSEEN|nr:IclR family transcriptional regulator [Pseudonocardia endophytica]TCK26325.1 IclR family transcriptional regulator [Pseudonocardia endophytica]
MSVEPVVPAGQAARTDPNTVQSVLRAAALLDCFADGPDEKGLSELARATGLSVSTAHRLLRTLAQAGLLWHDGSTERYLPGPGLLRLSRALLDRDDLASVRELLAAVALQVRLSVRVVVRRGDEVETVLVVDVDGTSPDAGPGERSPVHSTAAGKALLAYASESVRETVEALGTLRALTPETVTDPDALADELERVRTRAYAVADREERPDLRAVAVPVRSADGDVVAALEAVGTPERFDVADIARRGRLLAAAAGALGLPASLLEPTP